MSRPPLDPASCERGFALWLHGSGSTLINEPPEPVEVTGRAILVAYLHSETKPDSVFEDELRSSSALRLCRFLEA